jgi:uncharacterized membrane protein
MLLMIFLFACVGIALEVCFTALTDPGERHSLRLRGHSYLWMVGPYATAPLLLELFHPSILAVPLAARIALYVLILYAVEYGSGWLLRRATGRCPWDYGQSRWSVHGLIRLDYAPAWAAACWLFEAIFLRLRPLL